MASFRHPPRLVNVDRLCQLCILVEVLNTSALYAAISLTMTQMLLFLLLF